jgi:general secretion pathway protein I
MKYRLAFLLRGFTLIEVLVALAIVAIALTAGLKATAALSYNALRQSDAMLAQMCAENLLVKLRLARQMPPAGDTPTECVQAGQLMLVVASIRTTPNPNFLRVEARVTKAGQPVLQLTTVMGRY